MGDAVELHAEPSRELGRAFERWLDTPQFNTVEVDELYNKALRLTKGIPTSIPEAHGLLPAYRDRENIAYAGLFLSAIYYHSPESEIVLDIGTHNFTQPIDFIGYHLPPDKILVNKGKVDFGMGEYAQGPVINLGEAGWWMGGYAQDSSLIINGGEAGRLMGSEAQGGSVFNCGKADIGMGFGAQGGLLINWGEAGWWKPRSLCFERRVVRDPEERAEKVFLEEDDCRRIPKLFDYLNGLKAIVKEGKYASLPSGAEMRREIERILWKSGVLKISPEPDLPWLERPLLRVRQAYWKRRFARK